MQMPQNDPNAITFAIRPSMVQRNRPFDVLPIDQSLFTSVGAVVLYWGRFEQIFDDYLTMLTQDAWSLERDGKLNSQFKARKQMFLRLSARVFLGTPTVVAYFENLVSKAEELRWQRDIVAHGHWVSNHAPDKSRPVTFTATGKRNGKAVALEVRRDTLDEIWHRLAHLAGDLVNSSNVSDARHSLSTEDRLVVRAFVSKSRRSNEHHQGVGGPS